MRMTHTIRITPHILLPLFVVATIFASIALPAEASEITGTLNSDGSNNQSVEYDTEENETAAIMQSGGHDRISGTVIGGIIDDQNASMIPTLLIWFSAFLLLLAIILSYIFWRKRST